MVKKQWLGMARATIMSSVATYCASIGDTDILHTGY